MPRYFPRRNCYANRNCEGALSSSSLKGTTLTTSETKAAEAKRRIIPLSSLFLKKKKKKAKLGDVFNVGPPCSHALATSEVKASASPMLCAFLTRAWARAASAPLRAPCARRACNFGCAHTEAETKYSWVAPNSGCSSGKASPFFSVHKALRDSRDCGICSAGVASLQRVGACQGAHSTG